MPSRLVFLLSGLAMLPVTAMAASPFDGTWKEDASTGSFSKKPMKMVVKDGKFDCLSCTPAIHIKADGTDQPVTGHPGFDTVAVGVVDSSTITETDKRNGKVVNQETVTVAPGAKSATAKWTDTSSANPVSGTTTLTLASPGPAGSHATSGAWNIAGVAMSDTGLLMTLRVADGALSLSTPQGLSYTAKLDGTEAPFTGDPTISTVSVKMIGKRTLQETDLHDGKPLSVVTMKLAPDGKTMALMFANKLSGRTASFTAAKQ